MNRTMTTVVENTPSRLMGTVAIMGFAAENNLRDVAHALGKRDLAGLDRISEKNAKQARLRLEVEEQVVEEMSRCMIGTHDRHKLVLISQVALMFERMGARTVDISQLCEQLLREPRPSRVSGLKKLIEHAVYITDRAVTGLVEEDIGMAKLAAEQELAAAELSSQVCRELTTLFESGGEAARRAESLLRIASKADEIIGEGGKLAQDVLAFLERPEL